MTVLAIVGPTASGKSALAVRVAQRLGGRAEIVSTDSMQVYRGMDIGTATPTRAEMEAVPHHLLDVWEPEHAVTVAEFQVTAREAIDRILGSDGIPIVVGGSGLYVSAVLDDLRFPGTDPMVRARLEAELDDIGPAALHARLAQVDPAAAEAILPTNGRRIVRALEVIEITGEPFIARLPEPTEVYRTVRVGLDVPRDELDARIAERVDLMWERGFVDEVRVLREQGLADAVTASRALGYQQVLAFLAGACTEEQARQDTIDATRRFARRQQRWFRRDGRITWIRYDDARRPRRGRGTLASGDHHVVLGAKDQGLCGTRQAGEDGERSGGAVRSGLGRVRPQRGVLGRQVLADVHPVADLGPRRPRGVELVRRELIRGQVHARGQTGSAGDRLAGEGGLEQVRSPRAQVPRGTHRVMDLQVVRMPVPARRVVAHQDVGGLLVADLRDAPSNDRLSTWANPSAFSPRRPESW